jgi:hypothetical protein
MQEIQQNPDLVEEAIRELRNRGFRAVVEEVFELNDHHRIELDIAMTEDFEPICRDACIMALRRQGTIAFVHEGHHPPNMRAEVYCKYTGGVECGVRFDC